MPTYEYECTKCGHLFEVFQPITAEPVKKCPKCKGKVRKLISPGIGLIFKGSGFYITDYKNSGTRKSDNRNIRGKSSLTNANKKADTSADSSKNKESKISKKKNK